MQVVPPDLEKGFTQIPNELIFCSLSPALKMTWIQIASLCFKSKDRFLPGGVKSIAKELDIPFASFYKSFNRLRQCGGLAYENDTVTLLIPNKYVVATAKVKPADSPKEETETIAEELSKEAPRRPSGVTQKESMAQIAEAWNEAKPESFMLTEKRMALPLFIAIETHAKRLRIERPDYPDMIRQVLAACKANDWWKDRTIKPSNIFGWGSDIADKKFQSVERLYREGKKANRFDIKDPAQVLRWYNDKWPDISWNKVEMIEVDEYQHAWQHDVEVDPSGTIYLYTAKEDRVPGSICHWTGKNYNRLMRYTPN